MMIVLILVHTEQVYGNNMLKLKGMNNTYEVPFDKVQYIEKSNTHFHIYTSHVQVVQCEINKDNERELKRFRLWQKQKLKI